MIAEIKSISRLSPNEFVRNVRDISPYFGIASLMIIVEFFNLYIRNIIDI